MFKNTSNCVPVKKLTLLIFSLQQICSRKWSCSEFVPFEKSQLALDFQCFSYLPWSSLYSFNAQAGCFSTGLIWFNFRGKNLSFLITSSWLQNQGKPWRDIEGRCSFWQGMSVFFVLECVMRKYSRAPENAFASARDAANQYRLDQMARYGSEHVANLMKRSKNAVMEGEKEDKEALFWNIIRTLTVSMSDFIDCVICLSRFLESLDVYVFRFMRKQSRAPENKCEGARDAANQCGLDQKATHGSEHVKTLI